MASSPPAPGRLLRVRLTGRVALVTGGSQGLGRAIVAELAAQGATVTFTYLATGPQRSRPRRRAADCAAGRMRFAPTRPTMQPPQRSWAG